MMTCSFVTLSTRHCQRSDGQNMQASSAAWRHVHVAGKRNGVLSMRRSTVNEKRSGCPAACGGGNECPWAAGSMSAAQDRLRGYNGDMVLRRTLGAGLIEKSRCVFDYGCGRG